MYCATHPFSFLFCFFGTDNHADKTFMYCATPYYIFLFLIFGMRTIMRVNPSCVVQRILFILFLFATDDHADKPFMYHSTCSLSIFFLPVCISLRYTHYGDRSSVVCLISVKTLSCGITHLLLSFSGSDFFRFFSLSFALPIVSLSS